MTLETLPLLIAIDGDGVLLDYNRTFGALWERHFGVTLIAAEPRAYHATTFWGVPRLAKDHGFWNRFDEEGWRHMPAMPGALRACIRLKEAGCRLVCVTSMPTHQQANRLANLQDLGFPIEAVVATGGSGNKTENPKKAAIEALAPDWFVDDELRKLRGLVGVRCALIDPDHPDSPNRDQEAEFLSLRVASLAEFADALLGPDPEAEPKRDFPGGSREATARPRSFMTLS